MTELDFDDDGGTWEPVQIPVFRVFAILLSAFVAASLIVAAVAAIF